jgi:PleD family two-component response regulator
MDDKKIILAIDDNKMDLMVLNNFLAQIYDVRVSKSATEALAFLNSTKIDLILLDIAMPNMSGFEFLHEIRKNPRYMQTPVIVVSSQDTPEAIEHAKKHGANEYVLKPVDAKILQQKIETVLKSPIRVGILANL